MKKNLIKSIVLSFVFLFAAPTLAQEITEERLITRIQDLREYHQYLLSEIRAGNITPEEARAEWQALLLQLRLDKETLFESRVRQLQDRYQPALADNAVYRERLYQRAEQLAERRSQAETLRIEAVQKLEERREVQGTAPENLRRIPDAATNAGAVARPSISPAIERIQNNLREQLQLSRENIVPSDIFSNVRRDEAQAFPVNASAGRVLELSATNVR